MIYTVPDGFTAYNIAVILYGDTSYALKVLSDNNLNFSSNLSGLKITYDETLKVSNPIPVNVSPAKNINLTLRTNEGQTVYDMALMTVGLENIVGFLNSNNKDFAFSGVTNGMLNYTDINNQVSEYVKNKAIIFNTGIGNNGDYIDPGYFEAGYI